MYLDRKSTLCWTLAVVMTLAPSIVYAQPPAADDDSAAKLDVSYIVPDAAFGAVVFPRRVLTAPEAWALPVEVLSAASREAWGIDLVDVEEVLVFAKALASPGGPPPEYGMVVRLARSYALDNVLPELRKATEAAQIAGQPYRRSRVPMAPSYFMLDARTLLVAPDATLQKMVANHAKPVQGKVGTRLGQLGAAHDAAVVVLGEPLRPLLDRELSRVPLPPTFGDVAKVPGLIDVVEARANVVGQVGATLDVTACDEASAVELQKMIDRWIPEIKQLIQKDLARQGHGNQPIEKATAAYVTRISDRVLNMLRPTRQGDRLVLSTGPGGAETQMAMVGVTVALLLPAVQAAREAARRTMSTNNMKMLGIALLSDENTHRKFPARAIVDREGKPLLSWRVAILPYLDQDDLYRQFHLDEPWDSPHNKKLIARMPRVFRNPSSAAAPHTTTYLGPVGPGLFFDGVKSRRVADIADGMSNTVMLVEANDDQAVIWTKPVDWQVQADNPMAGVGRAHPGGFNVLFCDGHIQFVATDTNPQTWNALLSINGGETIDR